MAQEDIDKVYQLHTKFQDAMVNQDIDFLMSLFTEDAMVMAPGEPVARGSEQVRSWFENAFGAAVTEKLEARNEEYFDAGDCILETGEADWTTRPTVGGDSSTAQIKWLAVWHRQPGLNSGRPSMTCSGSRTTTGPPGVPSSTTFSSAEISSSI